MKFVIPFYHKEKPQVIELAKYLVWLHGGVKTRHTCLLIHTLLTDTIGIKEELEKVFTVQDPGKLAVWDLDERGWPASSNHLMERTVRYTYDHARTEPFFWCEADCVPLRSTWLDELEAEYNQALLEGKVFLGGHVRSTTFPHLTGCSVYPGDAMSYSKYFTSRLLQPSDKKEFPHAELPWDVATSEDVVPRSKGTKLICHMWSRDDKYQPILKDLKLADMPPEACIYHGAKNNSLILDIMKLRSSIAPGTEEFSQSPAQNEKKAESDGFIKVESTFNCSPLTQTMSTVVPMDIQLTDASSTKEASQTVRSLPNRKPGAKRRASNKAR